MFTQLEQVDIDRLEKIFVLLLHSDRLVKFNMNLVEMTCILYLEECRKRLGRILKSLPAENMLRF